MRTLNRWLRRSILGLMMLVCLGAAAAWCVLPAFDNVNWFDKTTRGAIALNRWRVGQTITLRVDGHGTWLLRNKSRLGVSDKCRWSFERAERPEFISCGTGLDSLRLGRDKSRCGFVLQVGA